MIIELNEAEAGLVRAVIFHVNGATDVLETPQEWIDGMPKLLNERQLDIEPTEAAGEVLFWIETMGFDTPDESQQKMAEALIKRLQTEAGVNFNNAK